MPQPIDMQTELGRMTMAERIQDASVRASLAALHRGQVEEEDLQRARQTQVNETPETQNDPLDGDGRRKNPYAEQRRGAQDGDADADAPKVPRSAPDGEHRLDVSI